jgi:hypothetical protein
MTSKTKLHRCRHYYTGDGGFGDGCPYCEIKRLRAALRRISDGPPGPMENSSVAAWAAWIAGHALVGTTPDETSEQRLEK